jgi:hypothetical protein
VDSWTRSQTRCKGPVGITVAPFQEQDRGSMPNQSDVSEDVGDALATLNLNLMAKLRTVFLAKVAALTIPPTFVSIYPPPPFFFGKVTSSVCEMLAAETTICSNS